jgi:hypothetical protein
MAILEFGDRVMSKEGLGGGSASGLRRCIFECRGILKNGEERSATDQVLTVRLFPFAERRKKIHF